MAEFNLPTPQEGANDKETIQNLMDTVMRLRRELEFVLQNIDLKNAPGIGKVIDNKVSKDIYESQVTQTASEISSKVSKDNIVSSINQTPEEIKIQADKITLQGAVTVLSDIAGNLGTINAGTINGVYLNTDKDVSIGESLKMPIYNPTTLSELLQIIGKGQKGIQFGEQDSINQYPAFITVADRQYLLFGTNNPNNQRTILKLQSNYGMEIYASNGVTFLKSVDIIDSGDGVADLWIEGDCSAQSFTDRTPFYEGDALSEIKQIKGTNGEIDHSTLPQFVRKNIKSKRFKDKARNKENQIMAEVEEEGRDLGAMISVLTVAVQQLTERIEKLEGVK